MRDAQILDDPAKRDVAVFRCLGIRGSTSEVDVPSDDLHQVTGPRGWCQTGCRKGIDRAVDRHLGWRRSLLLDAGGLCSALLF